MWVVSVPTPPFIVPLGVFSSPPPPELAEVDYYHVGEATDHKTSLWITRKVHELVAVLDKVRIMPPP